MSQTILVTGPHLAPAAVAVLRAAGYEPAYLPPYADTAALLSALEAQKPVGMIVRMGRIDGAVLDAAPQLRVISKHGVGVDTIDVDAASSHDIPVLVATGANAVSVAEHTMALLLAVAKRLVLLDRGLRSGRWEKPQYIGRELAGSTMGLVGFGAIAQQTARLARIFDLEVRAYDPFREANVFEGAGVVREETLKGLLGNSDIVSLHCPLTRDTRGLINAESIALMRPDAILINTARGGLVDEGALAEALAAGRIAGAGIDSFAQEPPPKDHPFFSSNSVVLTPHIGGVTAAANARVGIEAAQGIVDFLSGRPIKADRIVNRARLSNAVGRAVIAKEAGQ